MSINEASYEIFDAVKANNLKRVKELLDMGVDPTVTDFDTDATLMHYAASNGSKQTMEFLLSRGTLINKANNKGTTPLHTLILKRFDALALWAIKEGANLHAVDRNGHTPRDLAQLFFQKELDEMWNNKSKPLAAEPEPVQKKQDILYAPEQPAKVVREDNVRVFLSGGPAGAYKTVRFNNNTLASDLVKAMADKLNLSQFLANLEILENKKESSRRVGKNENVFDLKNKWPMVIGQTGNETHLHYYFVIRLRPEAPDDAQKLYLSALKGQ